MQRRDHGIIIEDGSPGGQGSYIDDRSTPRSPRILWLYLENNEVDKRPTGGANTIFFTDPRPRLKIKPSDPCIAFGALGPDLLPFDSGP